MTSVLNLKNYLRNIKIVDTIKVNKYWGLSHVLSVKL